MDAKKGFIKALEEHWFLTAPEAMIFSHFPDKPGNQFLKPPTDAKTFRGWPTVPRAFVPLGFETGDIREALNAKDYRGLIEAYHFQGESIRIRKAPLKKHLTSGNSYELRIEAKGCADVAVVNEGKWSHATPVDGVYRFAITPRAGALTVNAKFRGKGSSYWTILEYTVESEKRAEK